MRRWWHCAGVALVVAACGSKLRVENYPDPQALLDVSMREYRHGRCKSAMAGFEQLSGTVGPRDPLQATLKYFMAECTLRQGSPLEAARQFRRVADDFPQGFLAPDALLRAGDAYAELWRRPELDPSYGQNALDTWVELVSRYPNTVAAERAKLRGRELQEWFAAKAFKNGEFYRRLKAYDSAIIYYRAVVANYPDTPVAPRAVLALINTYQRIGYHEEMNDMCGYLRQYYPQAVPEAESCPPPRATP